MPISKQLLAVHPVTGGVTLASGFWGDRQRQNREVTIPHGIDMLEASGTLENLRVAAGRSSAEYKLPVFRDSDLYKVLEAVAWERAHGADPGQEQFFSSSVELLEAAQEPDGYINSYVQVVDKGHRFGDPAMGHELYCAGHLFQAAVADARTAKGPVGLWPVAERFATMLVEVLRSSQAALVEGHPEVETALAELYRTGGDKRFLELAEDLLGRRGHHSLNWHGFGPVYFQDDVPLEQARSVRGHAVRCLYLLAGATDLYTETGRPELLTSVLSQWEDMVSAKTYLTGGVGSRHRDEAFGDRFELPPDSAYCERCAAIASIMWNWRLLLLTGEARFADLMERTLYNGFLAGIGLDGKSFFYVNPLQARQPMVRSQWHYCACCPPNGMRLIASLEHYLATTSDRGAQLHQYASGRVRGEVGSKGKFEIEVETDYPFGGTVALRAVAVPGGTFEVAVRVPAWAKSVNASLNSRPVEGPPGPDGYLHYEREWSAGDEIVIEFPMQPRIVRPSEDVDSVRGCVAFARGPLVYCLEGCDVPVTGTVEGVSVASGHEPVEIRRFDVAGQPMVGLKFEAVVRTERGRSRWPYYDEADHGTAGHHVQRARGDERDAGDEPSSRLDGASAATAELRAVPYFAWANRGESDMRVWLPERR
jgi:uncharacterized protein